MGPLALIAKQAGYEVSGSDKQDSQYIHYLQKKGLEAIHIGQSREQFAKVHADKPIDWFLYSSAVSKENPDHPELKFCQDNNIKTSKRDELINKIIEDHKLKPLAIAGTHGKTTTTAMAIWLFKQLDVPISYSVGAKISFGDMGHFEPGSQYFVFECDEFDRNFLAFKPYLSIISGISWDHHEVYPTQQDYFDGFLQFLNQSEWKVLWAEDSEKLALEHDNKYSVLSYDEPQIKDIKLAGLYNRRNAWLVIQAIHELTSEPIESLTSLMNDFPGVSRRFEKITENLYSDYAHTTDKIKGVMSVAKETAEPSGQKIVVIYEPLTNRRMHYTAADHKDVFADASKIYWVPSYLAREDPAQPLLTPDELIKNLNPQLQAVASPTQLDDSLKAAINSHLKDGDLVVALSGGGGGSLDEWLRQEFQT